MPSATVENYVKAILALSLEKGEGQVGMGEIARSLKVAPGTATSMTKTLEREKLVRYKARQGVILTAKGRKLGMGMLRRHRLVETFLVKTLGLDWTEIHQEAEELEHTISERVLDRLDRFLGKPEFDPHGDPIPTKDGKIVQHRVRNLLECQRGTIRTVKIVTDQSTDFLNFARQKGLVPGAALEVLSQNLVSDAVEIRIGNTNPFIIGSRAAKKILVAS
jgi:DtxR family Mn-dependent transcriptional regulator|tara:strand:- start:763 stop:1422 length:660 start_codon:yes stop_codon:yes gene_type:complete